MTWQVNWKVWQWPWYQSQRIWYYGDKSLNDFSYGSNFAGIGPFQFHWYSK